MSKNINNKVKRPAAVWETFATEPTEDSIPENTEKYYKSIRKCQTIQLKWARDLIRYFTKEDIQMAKMHFKRCLNVLVMRQFELKH